MRMTRRHCLTIASVLACAAAFAPSAVAADQWTVLEGKQGPGKGKHIVLISGDDEYRSEDLIPAMAQILASMKTPDSGLVCRRFCTLRGPPAPW